MDLDPCTSSVKRCFYNRVFTRADEALALLESGKRSLLLEDVSTACNDLAMSCELMAEEHGEQSEKCAEVAYL